MSYETELKLSLPVDQVSLLKTLPFWKKFAKKAPETFHLGNTYFDTPEMSLNGVRVALRIREKNGQFFQTLKTKGESVGGLTRRGEWEWPIAEASLDLAGLAKVWPEALEQAAMQHLTELFATDFDRTCWQLEWPEPYAKVEAALDSGFVKAGNAQSRICELELELLEGSEEALQAIADELSKQVDLTPSDKSKAERGFELLAAAP